MNDDRNEKGRKDMMNLFGKTLWMLFFIGAGLTCRAQPKLEACAVRRSQALDSIVRMKKDTDSLASQQLASVDRAWQDCVVDARLPAFSREALPAGIVDSRDLKGKIVVINFWFTSCAPCIAEIPGLNRLVDEYKGRNVVFIGFTFEERKKIETDFLPKHPFGFRIVPEAGDMEKLFGVNDYPSTFVVDADGRVKKAWSGGRSDALAKDEIYQKIKSAIDEMPGQGEHK